MVVSMRKVLASGAMGRCFDLFVDKHKRAFSLVEKCRVIKSREQLALPLNVGIFRTVCSVCFSSYCCLTITLPDAGISLLF